MDVKQMIIAGLYIGTCSSLMILASDYKNFNPKIYLSTLPVCIAGTVIGVYIFPTYPHRHFL